MSNETRQLSSNTYGFKENDPGITSIVFQSIVRTRVLFKLLVQCIGLIVAFLCFLSGDEGENPFINASL